MDPAQLARLGTAVGRPIQRLHLRSLRDPNPDSRQQQDIGDGKLLLDQMTKYFIRRHLSYRFIDSMIEADVRTGLGVRL
jgi:hypothetical protein